MNDTIRNKTIKNKNIDDKTIGSSAYRLFQVRKTRTPTDLNLADKMHLMK